MGACRIGEVFPVELAADPAVQDLQLRHCQIRQALREGIGGFEVDPLGCDRPLGAVAKGIERMDRIGLHISHKKNFLVSRLSRGSPDWAFRLSFAISGRVGTRKALSFRLYPFLQF